MAIMKTKIVVVSSGIDVCLYSSESTSDIRNQVDSADGDVVISSMNGFVILGKSMRDKSIILIEEIV
jgi:hypothetical protein